MKKVLFLLVSLLCFEFNSFAQYEAVVKLIMPNNGIYFNLSEVNVYRIKNEQLLLDLIFPTNGEETTLRIPMETNASEMIRLIYNKKDNKFFDLLIMNGDTTIALINPFQDQVYPEIIQGNVNGDFIDYVSKRNIFKSTNSELIEQYNKATSKKEKESILLELENNRKEFEIESWHLTKQNQKNILGAYIYSSPIRSFKYKLNEEKRKKELIDNFWNGVNLNDERLLRTFLLYDLIEQYIGLFFEEGYSVTKQDSALKVAVTKVMDYFSESEEHRNYAYYYLLNAFESFDLDEMVIFILNNYISPDQCNTGTEDVAYSKRSEQEKNINLLPGKPAPDIILQNPDGSTFGLKDIKSDTVLIVFFSSTCPHCTKAMPQIVNLIKRTNIQIVAISADNNKKEYERYIMKYPNMIHYCDFKVEKSKPIIDYNIHSTPTFYLINKDRTIIDKYKNPNQLEQDLKLK